MVRHRALAARGRAAQAQGGSAQSQDQSEQNFPFLTRGQGQAVAGEPGTQRRDAVTRQVLGPARGLAPEERHTALCREHVACRGVTRQHKAGGEGARRRRAWVSSQRVLAMGA